MPLDGRHGPATLCKASVASGILKGITMSDLGAGKDQWLYFPYFLPICPQIGIKQNFYSVCDFHVPLCPRLGTSPACHSGKEPFGISKSRAWILALSRTSPVALSMLVNPPELQFFYL